MKVEIQCSGRVSYANLNAEFTEAQWAEYEKACEEEDFDYFERIAELYCMGSEYEYDWEVDADTVEVCKKA